jgi:choline/glycine/proline betaine transport protein
MRCVRVITPTRYFDRRGRGRKGQRIFRAEVHLAEGGQDYDVMGWSQEQIIVDILNQYEDHLHFLHTRQ